MYTRWARFVSFSFHQTKTTYKLFATTLRSLLRRGRVFGLWPVGTNQLRACTVEPTSLYRHVCACVCVHYDLLQEAFAGSSPSPSPGSSLVLCALCLGLAAWECYFRPPHQSAACLFALRLSASTILFFSSFFHRGSSPATSV